MVNEPYNVGRLFGAVRGRELPDWAAEFDCRSWGQFFLTRMEELFDGNGGRQRLRERFERRGAVLSESLLRRAALDFLTFGCGPWAQLSRGDGVFAIHTCRLDCEITVSIT